eukprot:5734837-Amphidinium_carterae.1
MGRDHCSKAPLEWTLSANVTGRSSPSAQDIAKLPPQTWTDFRCTSSLRLGTAQVSKGLGRPIIMRASADMLQNCK